MLIAFFEIDGLVHHEFVPTGQTVNKEFYKTVMQRLSDAVRRQCLRSGATGSCTTTTLLPTGLSPQKNFWRNKNIPSLPQPPYSPDLAPSEFFLFPQLKKTMKGRRFPYVEDIQANATRQLRAIKKVITKGAFVSGKRAEISAYKHKDTILKETIPTNR